MVERSRVVPGLSAPESVSPSVSQSLDSSAPESLSPLVPQSPGQSVPKSLSPSVPKSLSRKSIILLKVLAWIACLIPVARLVWGAVTNNLGPDPTATISFSTGYTTLMLLTITLAVTPVRRIIPRLSWIVRFRRLLGLFAFFYATLHLFTYIALYAVFNVRTMIDDIDKRRFITMGVTAWLLLVPLAVTSTNWAIRKLGGKRWNRLHMLVYLAATCGVIHYWWQVKTGVLSPMRFTIVIALLLLVRPVLALRQRMKARALDVMQAD
jgi:methionine sulfoxide reductase heme-binding subunit